jgi:hypothetical protein
MRWRQLKLKERRMMALSPASIVRSPRVDVDVVSFLGESHGLRSLGLAVLGVTLRCFPALESAMLI